MNGPRIGSLFSGFGGLDEGVRAVLGGEVAWHCEIEPAACRLLDYHWPATPNHGDVTAVDWAEVEPVDLLTAGYPCQPFSAAGRRLGEADERHLWPYVADALGALRPALFVGENVRGHLTLGFDQVVRDLQLLGYSVRWVVMRAADIGAPHGRARLFMLGEDARAGQLCRRAGGRRGAHRDQPHQGRRYVCDPGGGGDGHEGQPDLVGAQSDLWRTAQRDEAGDGSERAEDPMGNRGGRRAAIPACDHPASDLEEGAGGGLRRVPRCPCGEPRSEGATPLDGGASSHGGDREASHPRTQRAGAGTVAADTAGQAPCGDLPVGRMVGAGRLPVRPGGVHGSLPSLGPDGGGTHLRDAVAGMGDRAAWPAGDTAGVGWGEGRPESARLVGGSDVAVGGDGDICEHCGHDLWLHDAGGFCVTCPLGCYWGDLDAQREVEREVAADADVAGRRSRRGLGGSAGPAVVGDNSSAPADTESPARRGTQPEHLGASAGPAAELGERASEIAWGEYAPAIRRWELILGRPAPAPTVTGKRGGQQLSPHFVEWLMGLDEGHVTGVPGLSRNEQLKLLGNGVVWQQAAAALSLLLADVPVEVAA